MANPTLSDLLGAMTKDEIMALLISALQGADFPTTDWSPVGMERALVEMEGIALEDLIANTIPTVAGGGLVDYAEGDWLTLLAKQLYNVDRFPATRTVGLELLTNDGAQAYTIQPFDLTFLSDAGNRYVNTTGGALAPGGGTLVVTIQSESPNDSANGLDYVDGSDTITQMVIGLAGVSATNPAPTFSAVELVGSGTGTLTPSATDAVPANVNPTSIVLEITTGGDKAAAFATYTVNGGGPVGPTALAAPIVVGGGTDITMTFADGAVHPSFVVGDVYTFQAPGTWITQQGVDVESDELLRQRCKDQWAALSLVPTDGLYTLWARQASPQVTKVLITADQTIAGQVDILIAGPGGALGADVVNAVQAYVDKRKPLTDKVVVASADNLVVGLTGTVKVAASKLAAAQQAAQKAFNEYIRKAPIEGYFIGVAPGWIYWSEVLGAISTVDGVFTVTGLSINGGGVNTDLAVGGTFVAVSSDIVGTLTWTTVPG